jgi:hypothetical protein
MNPQRKFLQIKLRNWYQEDNWQIALLPCVNFYMQRELHGRTPTVCIQIGWLHLHVEFWFWASTDLV